MPLVSSMFIQPFIAIYSLSYGLSRNIHHYYINQFHITLINGHTLQPVIDAMEVIPLNTKSYLFPVSIPLPTSAICPCNCLFCFWRQYYCSQPMLYTSTIYLLSFILLTANLEINSLLGFIWNVCTNVNISRFPLTWNFSIKLSIHCWVFYL